MGGDIVEGQAGGGAGIEGEHSSGGAAGDGIVVGVGTAEGEGIDIVIDDATLGEADRQREIGAGGGIVEVINGGVGPVAGAGIVGVGGLDEGNSVVADHWREGGGVDVGGAPADMDDENIAWGTDGVGVRESDAVVGRPDGTGIGHRDAAVGGVDDFGRASLDDEFVDTAD